MTASALARLSADFDDIRGRVESCLEAFLADKCHQALGEGLVPEVPAVLSDFITAGGKRIRPLLCVLGWQAAGGRGLPDMVVQTAAALEMYQAFALIHDDVIDKSARRRFQPTVHRTLAGRYASSTDPQHLGVSAAILIGNMALTWSDELFTTAGMPASRLVTVRRVVDAMREEMHYGQYLDLLATLGPLADERTAMTVIEYKTAKYTVERPLHVGAALAGADAELLGILSRFALPLGEAFQLRDDLLGVCGDPAVTGKPVLDDLREGKHTVLLAIAARRADAAQREVLERLVGDPSLDDDGATQIVKILMETQAPAQVEDMIEARHQEALAALDEADIPPASAAALRQIASLAVERTS